MIEELRDCDLFKSEAEWLVCPVNQVGVMGNGLALAFKNRVMGLFPFYRQCCASGVFKTHGLALFKNEDAALDKTIVCFPSKRHYKDDSYLEDISIGLCNLVRYAEKFKPARVAVPMVGCGKGNLDRGLVLTLMYQKLESSDTIFEIYI